MEFLNSAPDKVEVILQWIQRTTILNHESKILTAPPPILSRAFQEVSRGIVNLQNARKIADFPFPFPYAQISMMILLIHWSFTPIACAFLFVGEVRGPILAATISFLVIFVIWSVNFIALQLESPFGDKSNDLPMVQMQREWNKSLSILMFKMGHTPPGFLFDPQVHRQMRIISSDGTESEELFKPRPVLLRRQTTSMLLANSGDIRYSMAHGRAADRPRSIQFGSLFSSCTSSAQLRRLDRNQSSPKKHQFSSSAGVAAGLTPSSLSLANAGTASVTSSSVSEASGVPDLSDLRACQGSASKQSQLSQRSASSQQLSPQVRMPPLRSASVDSDSQPSVYGQRSAEQQNERYTAGQAVLVGQATTTASAAPPQPIAPSATREEELQAVIERLRESHRRIIDAELDVLLPVLRSTNLQMQGAASLSVV
jgi:hypothetical protein